MFCRGALVFRRVAAAELNAVVLRLSLAGKLGARHVVLE